MVATVAREVVRQAFAMGAKLVVLVSGSDAPAQLAVLTRVAAEVTAETVRTQPKGLRFRA